MNARSGFRSKWMTAVSVLFTCLTPPAGGAAPDSPFAQLLTTWRQVRDFTVTIEATEWLGGTTIQNVLHYAFRKPERARLDVVAGPSRGAVLIWRGGDGVTAYQRSLAFVKVRAGANASRVTSPRGNGVLTPNLGDVLECFARHRGDVRERPGPRVDGDATNAIVLNYTGGVTCPDDSSRDGGVTRDVLYVSRRTGYVVRRERYERESLVEEYALRDLRIDEGLPDDLFR